MDSTTLSRILTSQRADKPCESLHAAAIFAAMPRCPKEMQGIPTETETGALRELGGL
jgi:hypothetical protein